MFQVIVVGGIALTAGGSLGLSTASCGGKTTFPAEGPPPQAADAFPDEGPAAYDAFPSELPTPYDAFPQETAYEPDGGLTPDSPPPLDAGADTSDAFPSEGPPPPVDAGSGHDA
jgi:hypothetical protein